MLKTILIIEDDPFILDIYQRKLVANGFTIITALDGKSGLDKIIKDQADLVLLDIKLPEIDGFEVLKQTRSNPQTQNVPIILLTNLSEREDIKRGIELGANDYIIKGRTLPDEVIKKIRALLKL